MCACIDLLLRRVIVSDVVDLVVKLLYGNIDSSPQRLEGQNQAGFLRKLSEAALGVTLQKLSSWVYQE